MNDQHLFIFLHEDGCLIIKKLFPGKKIYIYTLKV